MNKRRYENHFKLDGFSPDLQEKIAQTRILVIGAGGLGCPLLVNLAMLGIGFIRLADDDIIQESNLNRQFLFPHHRIGEQKAEVAAEFLRAFNPQVSIETHIDRFKQQNANELLDGIDYAIDCSDNLATRYSLDIFCSEKRIPMIFGGVRKYEGQVGVFHFRSETRFSDVFPPSAEVFASEDCNVLGTTGFVCQNIASWQAAELFKMISGQGEILEGKLLMIDQLNVQHMSIQHS